MTNFFTRITSFTNRLRSDDSSSTNEFSMPAARLANGARSPPTFHINGINHQTPELQKKDEIEESPVMITSGKFSPPPYLFEGLRNPFSDPWCSDTSKEDGTSLNSIGMKELSTDSTLERHVKYKTDSLDDEGNDEVELWPLPPPSPQHCSEPPKQKPPLAPKPPIPPKLPVSTPYAVPIIIPSTSSTLTRKKHHSQYAQPSILTKTLLGSEEISNSDSSQMSPKSVIQTDNTFNGLQHSMMTEIDQTYNEIKDQTIIPESPRHSPPPLPTKLPLLGNNINILPEPTTAPPPPPPPPPLPPPTLPISPLSSPPTSPPDSPPSSPALSPQTSSSTSESQASSSPNSPPHYLLNWR